MCESLLGAAISSSSLSYLRSPDGLREIWDKMPDTFIERWHRVCSKIMVRGGEPSMEHLTEFMESYIKERDNLYFCDDSLGVKAHKALITGTTPAEPPLATDFCEWHSIRGHQLVHCLDFKRASHDRRREFVRRNNLCYRCFGKHFAKNCTTNIKCDTCDKGHNTLLHPNSSSTEPTGREGYCPQGGVGSQPSRGAQARLL